MDELKDRRWNKFVKSTGLNDSAIWLIQRITYLILIGFALYMLICSVLITRSYFHLFAVIGVMGVCHALLLIYLPKTDFFNLSSLILAIGIGGYFFRETELYLINNTATTAFHTYLFYFISLMALIGVITALVYAYVLFSSIISVISENSQSSRRS